MLFLLSILNLFPLFESRFNQTAFALNFTPELFLGREIGQIFGGKDLFAVVEDGVTGDSVALFGAEDQPDGRVVVVRGVEPVKHADITVHLADVAMG